MASIRPQSVSYYLGKHQFERSTARPSSVRGYTTYTAGFQVYSYEGRTFVEYVLGDRMHRMDRAQRIETYRAALDKMGDVLEGAYAVKRLFPEDSTSEVYKLEILPQDA
jgi:hypothetical protein